MTKKMCVILMIIFSVLAFGFSTSAQTELRQWASSAEATSQYGTTDWSANQATGAPNAMTTCADSSSAWASEEASDGEVLTLYYNNPVKPTQINIHQNFSPGAITSVELIPEQGDFTIPIANSKDTSTPCPGIFSIDVILDTTVIGVAIHIDQAAIANWNEIDAVELVGLSDSAVTTGPGGGPGSGSSGPGGNTAPTAVPPRDIGPPS